GDTDGVGEVHAGVDGLGRVHGQQVGADAVAVAGGTPLGGEEAPSAEVDRDLQVGDGGGVGHGGHELAAQVDDLDLGGEGARAGAGQDRPCGAGVAASLPGDAVVLGEDGQAHRGLAVQFGAEQLLVGVLGPLGD